MTYCFLLGGKSLTNVTIQALFVAGKPFYEDKADTPAEVEEDSEAVAVLNECDMGQYKALDGEWVLMILIFYTVL